MHFHDDNFTAYQAFLENAELSEEMVKCHRDNKHQMWTYKLKVSICALSAHILGWVLALQVTLCATAVSSGSGDEINGIAPPGNYLSPLSDF